MTTNKPRIKFATLCFILIIGTVTAFAQGSYTRISDLAYAGTSLSTQKLDLYIPAGATAATPLVIWIHGGGWIGGDKALNPSSFQLRYAQNGYAVASINYRLSSQAIFPAQIHDCKAAIRWLRANADQYNLDTTRFAVWGSSAGGHLAALLGTSNDVVDMEGSVGGNNQHSSRVQAVVDWYGPTDFLQMDTQLASQGCGNGNHNAPDSAESLLIGCPIQSCPAAVQRANPMTYFSSDDPPFFIQHGTVDCTVPTGQSQILQNLLQGSGHDTSLITLSGAGHGGPQFSAESNLLLVDAFLDAKLRQSVNPLVTSMRIFRKSAEATTFRAGSLGSLYRLVLTGLNFQDGTKVLVNGVEKGVSYSNPTEVVIYELPGRIAPSGEISVQIKNSNGRFSNVLRSAITP